METKTIKLGRVEYKGWLISQTKGGCFIGAIVNKKFVRHTETPRTLQAAKDVIDEHVRNAY